MKLETCYHISTFTERSFVADQLEQELKLSDSYILFQAGMEPTCKL